MKNPEPVVLSFLGLNMGWMMCLLHYLYTPSSQGNIVRGSEASKIEDCAANIAKDCTAKYAYFQHLEPP
jgi:hypothetical protein|tara:strand:+ start:707 stop:913 length:207 start_codon:yes stop_codon:yes gene_type:complete